MHIDRIGLAVLKGTRHRDRDRVHLAAGGPVGDRVFCLVDPARARALRTVEHPTLVAAVARWDAGVLSVDLPGGTVEAALETTGEVGSVDYWGRPAAVETVAGPWAEAFSHHLGHDVELARVRAPGEVVYGAAVTVLSTASLRHLAERVGHEVHEARFRSTFTVDAGDEPHVEDSWVGRELHLGEATVRVRGRVPRCAVVDLDPVSGRRDARVMAALGGYRRGQNEVHFGVDAVVVRPGDVRTRDPIELGRG